jgi:hypothetical protein
MRISINQMARPRRHDLCRRRELLVHLLLPPPRLRLVPLPLGAVPADGLLCGPTSESLLGVIAAQGGDVCAAAFSC